MDYRAHSSDLFLDKFHPISRGSLKGELLDNSSIGPAPALTWSLEFDWPEGNPSVDVMIGGIPLDVHSWRELEGAQVECTASDEPIAAYVCDGDHFEFEYVHIQVLRQVGTVARLAIKLEDCDEQFRIQLADGETVELDRIWATVDVDFEGIRVEPDVDRELAEFTDTAGLVFDAASGWYTPAPTAVTGNYAAAQDYS